MARTGMIRREEGLALVELTLVIMLLVLLTFGVMEYGWMFFRVQQVCSAAREGVRDAIVPDATVADVQATITSLMTSWGMGGSGYTVDISPSNIADLEPGEPVSVTVQVPYSNIHLLGMPVIPTPETLRSRVVMAKEGP